MSFADLSFPICNWLQIADTRTDKPLTLGHALLQHQLIGILPTSSQPLDLFPLQEASNSTIMPEAWVRSVIFLLRLKVNIVLTTILLLLF